MSWTKPLLGIPSPRNLQLFKQHIDQLTIDKLWLKYYTELEAYQLLREFFLDTDDYTHLIICPDDLIVKRYDLLKLVYDLDFYGFPVVSGLCNVDGKDSSGVYNITTLENLPHADPAKRSYRWLSDRDIKHIIGRGDAKPFQVGYAGFPLFAISRDVVNKIAFRNDGGCCIDVMFCWDCHKQNIPIYVDPKINMLHLKRQDGQYDDYMVGQKKPFMYLQELNT